MTKYPWTRAGTSGKFGFYADDLEVAAGRGQPADLEELFVLGLAAPELEAGAAYDGEAIRSGCP